MHELSLYDIDQISRDISRQEIIFSHLLEDLIDHVCCDVEDEMQNGLTFSEAYQRVKKKMGSRRLKEIQEETLYLVDSKYRKMKNTMKITGIAGTVLLGFGALFKIQHWPLAGVLMTVGALILAFVFMPSALGVLWKETHSGKKLFLFISAFLAGMFFILGTLFKVQHWPGAGVIITLATLFGMLFFIPALLVSKLRDIENKSKRPVYIFGAVGMIFYTGGMSCKIQHWPLAGMLMVLGMIILCGITFPWYTWVTWKEKNNITAGFIFIVISLLLIVLPGALVNLNLQNSYESGFFTNMERQQVMYNSIYDNNQSHIDQYHDSTSYPEIEQLHSRTTTLLSLIGTIQVNMIEESEGKPGIPAVNPVQIKLSERGLEIQYNLLSRPFHTAPVKDYLLPGSSSRENLEAGLKEYMNYLSGIITEENLQEYTNILQLADTFSQEMVETGIISLMTGLHALVLLKSSILTLESYVLSEIVKN